MVKSSDKQKSFNKKGTVVVKMSTNP